ncbi:MAG: hypothetical protein ACREUL_00545 [Steroidobacteraceae bacterium]
MSILNTASAGIQQNWSTSSRPLSLGHQLEQSEYMPVAAYWTAFPNGKVAFVGVTEIACKTTLLPLDAPLLVVEPPPPPQASSRRIMSVTMMLPIALRD